MTDVDKVTMLFGAAGITPSADELAFFGGAYPMMRMMADMLFAVDADDAEPGLVFDPAPVWE